jgi:hypothetical protein
VACSGTGAGARASAGGALPWRDAPYAVGAGAGAEDQEGVGGRDLGLLLLAVGGEAGWLRIFSGGGSAIGAAGAWREELSLDGLAAPLASASFGPRSETLAVAGPAAPKGAVAALGRDAAAVAAAGGAPGCVSVWERRARGGWRLCQQWALAAAPAAAAFADAACTVSVLPAGRGAAAVQALRLLALPAAGGGGFSESHSAAPVVLRGQRRLGHTEDDELQQESDDRGGAVPGMLRVGGGASAGDGVAAQDSGVWPDASRRCDETAAGCLPACAARNPCCRSRCFRVAAATQQLAPNAWFGPHSGGVHSKSWRFAPDSPAQGC